MRPRTHSASKNASSRMVSDVPTVLKTHTLADVRRHIEHRASEFSTINYVYVLDEHRKLFGVLSLRQLFQFPPSAIAGDVCKKSGLIAVHPDDHQEKVAYLSLKNNIKALPVVSKDHVFLGEIPSDAVLSILHAEMHEDALRHAGIGHSGGEALGIFRYSIFASLRHRLPWLILGLVGGLLAAMIIDGFEATLSKNLILASFIPLIVYMSDAVGTQMEAYIIRDLAMERSLPFFRYFLRHFLVVFTLGLILASLLGLSFGFLQGDWFMAFVISISLFVAVLSSVCTGLIIPYVCFRMSLDPADMSGPVATIIQDVLSIVIYFSVATLVL